MNGQLSQEKPCIHIYETGKHEYNCLTWKHFKDALFWIPTCQTCGWIDTQRILDEEIEKTQWFKDKMFQSFEEGRKFGK